MKLPKGDEAIVDEPKVRDYLLSFEHPVGRSKAKFFASLGLTRDNWQELQFKLLELAKTGEAEPTAKTEFGQKYLVRGTIEAPDGRHVELRTVWIILDGEAVPRFVTAYPGDRR